MTGATGAPRARRPGRRPMPPWPPRSARFTPASSGTNWSARVPAELRSSGQLAEPQARRPAHEGPSDCRGPLAALQAHQHSGTLRSEAGRSDQRPVRFWRSGSGADAGHHLRAHRQGMAVPGGGARSGRQPTAALPDERTHRHPARRQRSRHDRRTSVAGPGLAQSVGRVGPSADNAVVEPDYSGLKRELVHRHRYPNRTAARRSIFEWPARYITHRRHASLDCRALPPSHRGQPARFTLLTGQRGLVPKTAKTQPVSAVTPYTKPRRHLTRLSSSADPLTRREE